MSTLLSFGVAGRLGSRLAATGTSLDHWVSGVARQLDRQFPPGVTPAAGDLNVRFTVGY